MPHTYKKSRAFLRDRGVPYVEMLDEAAFSEYQLIREQEEREYATLAQRRREAIRDAQVRGRATRLAQRAARRSKLAAILRARPDAKLTTLAKELGVGTTTLWRDRVALNVPPASCFACGRPLP